MTPDIHRPLYHFLPPANWMNDPNGLIYWQGRYHMFYQYNPHGPQWGLIHWGHADSPDLVHWTHRPIAIAPGKALTPPAGGPDEDGIFSGCAVAVDDQVAFLYTGVVQDDKKDYLQSACLAWGEGNLETLRRDPANPVISTPPPGVKATDFRDHAVWKTPDGWRMAIGSGEEDKGGRVQLYASPDLRAWSYLGPLLAGEDVPPVDFNLGVMWECPSVFFDGERTGLIISACGNGGYGTTVMTGRYSDPRFTPQVIEKLDYGGTSFYAPQTFVDANGRVLMFGWLQEARAVEAQIAAGWSGVMSLPRRLWIDAQGKPRSAFVSELRTLRRAQLQLSAERVPEGLRFLGVQSRQLEIVAEFERGSARRGGLSLLRSLDGQEETRLALDWDKSTLTLERGRSNCQAALPDLSAPFSAENGRLRLHLFLDGSTIECIANERVSLTGRVYPARADSLALGLFAEGGELLVPRLDVYQLASAW